MRINGTSPAFGSAKHVAFGNEEHTKIAKELIENGASDLRIDAGLDRWEITPKEAEKNLAKLIIPKITDKKLSNSQRASWKNIWERLIDKK